MQGGDAFSAKTSRLSRGDLILNLMLKISVDFCRTEQSEINCWRSDLQLELISNIKLITMFV